MNWFQEAEYIRAAIEISGEEYFGTMDKVSKRTRVTWIDKDGKVLYDTGNDQETLANHKSKKRIQRGIGKWQWTGYPYVRQQRTGRCTHYALKMDDSSVLRVSRGHGYGLEYSIYDLTVYDCNQGHDGMCCMVL